jgi:hypothetical protein
VELNIIQKGGSWYSFEEVKLQGEESFIDHMNNNPEWTKAIEQLVLQAVLPKTEEVA